LTTVAIETGVPTVFGIVTANNLRQARVRCVGKTYNRGREAAHTAIQLARTWKTLGSHRANAGRRANSLRSSCINST
jgi:6,7-dimethyl-8-ribityllumazine synthase